MPEPPVPLPITPAQMRVARGLLGWSPERLAMMSGATIEQVRQFELTGEVASVFWQSSDLEGLRLIRAALEQAGIEFVDEDGGGAGARLRKANQV